MAPPVSLRPGVARDPAGIALETVDGSTEDEERIGGEGTEDGGDDDAGDDDVWGGDDDLSDDDADWGDGDADGADDDAPWDDGWAEPLQKAGQLPSWLRDLVARARDLHRRVRRFNA